MSLFTISQTGDTFSNNWILQNSSTFLAIQSLTLNGVPGNTIFDTTFGGAEGTPTSASGASASGTTSDTSSGVGTYTNRGAISPNAPVGDLFTVLTINFSGPLSGLGPGASASFLADTDSIGLFGGDPGSGTTPEPSTLSMLVLAGVVFYGARRLAFAKAK